MAHPKFTLLEAETLLRAAVIFKFEGGDAAHVFSGSPYFASSITSLLEFITYAHTREGRPGKAEAWRETYRLAGNDDRWEWVSHQAPTHPKWGSLGEIEKKAWVDTLAAPYWLEDQDYASIYRHHDPH